jgi:hypothetical protein
MQADGMSLPWSHALPDSYPTRHPDLCPYTLLLESKVWRLETLTWVTKSAHLRDLCMNIEYFYLTEHPGKYWESALDCRIWTNITFINENPAQMPGPLGTCVATTWQDLGRGQNWWWSSLLVFWGQKLKVKNWQYHCGFLTPGVLYTLFSFSSQFKMHLYHKLIGTSESLLDWKMEYNRTLLGQFLFM